MVLRESANGRTVKNTVKRFRAIRAWHKVVMTATTRRAGTQLNVRLVFTRARQAQVRCSSTTSRS